MKAGRELKISSGAGFRCSRPTVAEINLGALLDNYRALRALAPEAHFMAVVKANAYGHGAVEVARALAADGCQHFGVATVGEARELRETGLQNRIYLMGGFFPEQAPEVVELDLIPFVIDLSEFAPLEAAAAASARDLPVHLKLDTGATRLGIGAPELPAAIEALRAARHLHLEGLCTLLASAGDPTSTVTQRQLETFKAGLETLRAAAIVPRYAHIANSAAAALRRDTHFNMIRMGLALYGLPPVAAVAEAVALKPVMTFKTRLLQKKNVPAGTGVSYGHTFVTRRASTIGILPVGYADGYRRGLQHGGEVLVRGQRAPVVGAVCMDITMVDLTDIAGAEPGDEVILWGGLGEQSISANEVARLVQTISYEMLCTVGRRVSRVYV